MYIAKRIQNIVLIIGISGFNDMGMCSIYHLSISDQGFAKKFYTKKYFWNKSVSGFVLFNNGRR